MDQQHVEEYLARIGYTAEPKLDGATLDALIKAHIAAVPFENLDVCEFHLIPSLNVDDLFEKVVRRKRGGYCFELNTLFGDLLSSLGFPLYYVATKGIREDGTPRTYGHMGIIAEAEGKTWYCDVGFGGPGPKGVYEVKAGEQLVAGVLFRIDREGMDVALYRNHGENWENVSKYMLRPWDMVDFDLLNFYCARSEKSSFPKMIRVNLTLPDGSKALTGNHLTVRKGGSVYEMDCADRQEIMDVLHKEFGLDVILP